MKIPPSSFIHSPLDGNPASHFFHFSDQFTSVFSILDSNALLCMDGLQSYRCIKYRVEIKKKHWLSSHVKGK